MNLCTCGHDRDDHAIVGAYCLEDRCECRMFQAPVTGRFAPSRLYCAEIRLGGSSCGNTAKHFDADGDGYCGTCWARRRPTAAREDGSR